MQSAQERSARVGELYAALAERIPEHTTAEWLKIFHELDIPCTRVNSMQDLIADEHLDDVGFFYDSNHPSEGSIRSMRSPFWIKDVEHAPDVPAPSLNKHSDAITWYEIE